MLTSEFKHTISPDVELFNEFFDQGMEESVSPFLTAQSRRWGVNLPLKSSLVAAFFLLASFLTGLSPSQLPLSNLFLLLTFFFAGTPALIGSLEDLISFEINIDILMTFAAFASVFIGSGQEGGLLLVLFAFSGALEQSVRAKAKSAISALKKISPSKAWVIQSDGSLIERSVQDISPGMHILVKAGQIVPLDGVISNGSSSLDMSALTGESQPVSKKEGDEVPSGTMTLEGSLTLKVIRTSGDSALARIIQLITQAQEAKPRFQRWLDKITKTYASSILLATLFLFILLPFVFSIPFFGPEGSFYRSLAFLIAASPCALILALPIAYLSALSACAKKGILLKGGVLFDALSSCKILALDKTGTLTTGKLSCLGMESATLDGPLFLQALEVAYGLEQNALHPMAQALIQFVESQQILPAPIERFRLVPGYGLKGFFQGEEVFLGNRDFLLPYLNAYQKEWLLEKNALSDQAGELTAFLFLKNTLFLFRFEDQMRPHLKESLQSLRKKHGYSIVMLTGDREKSAQRVAREMGIDEVFAELKPEDKLSYIDSLIKQGNLAMVGDGINDAPALARATVGISMGKAGSATAINASDVILLQDNIDQLPWLIEKAKKTGQIVRQNIIFALAAIIFASIPALLGWVPLWLAVVIHEGGTTLVGLNALRLLKKN